MCLLYIYFRLCFAVEPKSAPGLWFWKLTGCALPFHCRLPSTCSVQTEFSMEQRGESPLGCCWDVLRRSWWKQEQAAICSGDCFPARWKLGGGVPTLSLPTVRCCGPWWSLSPLLLIHNTHSLLHVCHFYVNECKNLHIIISIFKHQLQRFLFLQVNVRCPLI